MARDTQGRIAIVTDSTADLPCDLIEQYDIRVAPQVLIMGENTWRDGVDIDPPAFYELLKTSSGFPSSSQPSVIDFREIFRELSREATGIVAVLVSDDLSGTLNSAQMAAESLPDVPVRVVDSRSVSLGLGFTVLAAAKAAAAGGDLQTVANAARAKVGHVHVYFVVDTLEYLHRGGRIGGAAKLLGSALDLKPVLEIKDGIVKPLTRVRTRRKALSKTYELLQGQFAEGARIHMGVLNIDAPEEAAHFKEELEARFQPIEMLESECSPVVGAHAGPGTVGVAFYVE